MNGGEVAQMLNMMTITKKTVMGKREIQHPSMMTIAALYTHQTEGIHSRTIPRFTLAT